MSQQPGREQEHTLQLKTPSGPATLVLQQKGRLFTVRSFEVEGKPGRTLAFAPNGPGVENLDNESDAMQVFGCSVRIRLDGVLLGASEMKASSIEELTAALAKAKLRTFDREEI